MDFCHTRFYFLVFYYVNYIRWPTLWAYAFFISLTCLVSIICYYYLFREIKFIHVTKSTTSCL